MHYIDGQEEIAILLVKKPPSREEARGTTGKLLL